ncbi:MAG: helix-turn-helix domain-containing protein [Veillonella parvula]
MIIKQLRTANNLTQGQLAERLMVTRQAVRPLGKRRNTAKHRNAEITVS